MNGKRMAIQLGLVALVLACILGVFSLDPIPQDPGYHVFGDRRTLLGLPNFFNVVSNLPFVMVGVTGVYVVLVGTGSESPARLAFAVFFVGIALVGCGSSYYHIMPNNATLVWDRLPMSIAFMALFAALIGEYVGVGLGKRLLFPLVATGVASVVYWDWTEGLGRGDLRFYALVQFLPLILIPVILFTRRARFTRGTDYGWALGFYVLAKVAEHLDAELYSLGQLLSGHTIKHVLAALGAYWLLRMLERREKLPCE